MKIVSRMLSGVIPAIALFAAGGISAHAQTVTWAGYTWNVNSGNSIGSGLVTGDANNVSVDGSGNLHLVMTNSSGTWKGAELGTISNLGFGSYYWVFSGPLTTLDPQAVLAGFTYGPAHSIGMNEENEIDVEFSKWNVATSANNGDFNIFPATGGTKGVNSVDLWNWTSGTVATCRIDWNPTQVVESVWSGVAATNASTSTAAITWTYNGTTSTIPQSACPFYFNLWASGSIPANPVDITVKNFQFIPLVTPAAPTGLTATAGATQIGLSWAASSGATSYNVYRGFSSGTESTTPIATGITGTSYTDFGMTVGNTYYYKVAAVNGAGTSPLSNEASAVPTGSNIAPSGTGYLWSANTTATSNSNRVTSTGVNDGNLTTSVNVNPSGEGGTVKYEGAGVVWSATHTVTSATFINGANDGGGNGYFQANCQLQFTTDGTTWTNSGWTCSPTYPNSSSAWSQTYTFHGSAVSGVKGVRIVGQTGSSSWRWLVKEVQVLGL